MQKTTVDTFTCPLIDIRHLLVSIEVTKDTIVHGQPMDQEWITFYESDEILLDSEEIYAPYWTQVHIKA
ncbi:MAG: hypothetical protein U5N56_05255 [Candidatus Marinimicrobia bacterium]|nr:hypothetical protein [Candidatus Neomarinimicrobiota bacterium]